MERVSLFLIFFSEKGRVWIRYTLTFLANIFVGIQQIIFTNSAPLGQVGHRVAMSVCLSVCLFVCLRHRLQFFSRPLIGPQIT